jgi:hypothetical protein
MQTTLAKHFLIIPAMLNKKLKKMQNIYKRRLMTQIYKKKRKKIFNILELLYMELEKVCGKK